MPLCAEGAGPYGNTATPIPVPVPAPTSARGAVNPHAEGVSQPLPHDMQKEAVKK